MKHLLFATFLMSCVVLQSGYAQSSTNYFAKSAFLSTGFGAHKDWVGDRNTLWEHAYFWDQRAGISISRRLYSGFLVQLIRAGNFEQPAQSFYTAGVWGRYHIIQPFLADSPKRWGLFGEAGVQTGNFAYEYRNEVQFYKSRPGLYYVQLRLAAVYRIWKNLGIEAATQLLVPTNGSWDQHGTGYLSVGLSWYLHRG